MKIFPKILFALLLGFGTRAWSASFADPKFLMTGTANFHSVDTAFQNPVSFELQMGTMMNRIYLGLAGDYFLAAQGTTTLNLMTGGLELGVLRSYPRFFWLAVAGMFYPLSIDIAQGTDAFANAVNPFSYRARLLIGIRLSPSLALTIGGGYRWMLLGHFAGPSGAFAGNPVDLSGMVLSGGFTLTL